jgi:hypothetical protein
MALVAVELDEELVAAARELLGDDIPWARVIVAGALVIDRANHIHISRTLDAAELRRASTRRKP